MALKQTKIQTGLSTARKGNVYTVSWKNPQKYLEQMWEYDFYDGKGNFINDLSFYDFPGMQRIAGDATTKSFTLKTAKFYPNTAVILTKIVFDIWGAEGAPAGTYTHQFTSAYKTVNLQAPNAPSIKATPSDSQGNVCVFEWTTSTSDTDTKPLADVEWQSILVANSTEADGSKLPWKSTQAGWQTGTKTANNSVTITEGSASIATGSHTRWVRVRSRGPAGASAWKYAKRVYANPNAPTITSTKSTKTANGYQVLVNWTSAASNAFPAAENDLEYLRTVPGPGLSVPAGATFTKALTIKRAIASNAAAFNLNTALGEDEVLFTRVTARHIKEETPSAPVIAQYGFLKSPTIGEIVTDPSTYRATITATNRSGVSDSFIVILYRTASNPNKTSIVGIIPPGSTSTTVQLPNWSQETGVGFGLYAAVGSYEQIQRADGLSSYAVTAKMKSDGIVWGGGVVPQPPSQVTAEKTDTAGQIKVTWNWTWTEATSSILSWADNPEAWQSTDEPKTYEVFNIGDAEWFIPGLDTGKKWFVRVRLIKEDGDARTMGPWSEIVEIDLASAPQIPVLSLSSAIITTEGSVTAYWTYTSTDGTPQAYAEVAEATLTQEGEFEITRVLAGTQTASNATIYAEDAGWEAGETHYIAVRTMSASGLQSNGWSDPVPVTIAEPLIATFAATNLVEETTEGRTYTALKAMPLTATITGAGAGGTTSLVIERAEDYHITRPNGDDFNGYEGETIANYTQTGDDPITINLQDLTGPLDEGARYRLIGIVQDGLGQYAEEVIEFEPHWTHQAVMPEGMADIQDQAAIITPIAPAGFADGDTCDIYRLSADKPELIYEGATFGETYVDPFPAIGQFGGHRLVYRTADGDYITGDNELAWLDLTGEDGANLEADYTIIEFENETLLVRYNMGIDNAWEKDFITTKYLGGNIAGDWNKGITRTGKVGAVTVSTEDPETIRAIKRLANYPGLCHIRTPEGSSFAGNIQVDDAMSYTGAGKIYNFNLNITKIDTHEADGLTYDEWAGGDSE